MSHKALTTFIAQKRSEGIDDEEIRTLLISKEWREDLVNAAIAGEDLSTESFKVGVPTPEATSSTIAEYPTPINRIKLAWSVLSERFIAFALTVIAATAVMFLGGLAGVIIFAALGGSFDDVQALMMTGSHLKDAQTQNAMMLANNAFLEMFKAFFEANILAVVLSIITSLVVIVPAGFFLAGSRIYIAAEKPAPTAETAARGTWSKLLGYMWVQLLVILVIIGGTFLFVIPGIIAFVGLSLSSYAYFIEGKQGATALERSFEIVRANLLAIIGHGLFVTAVAGAASSLVGALSSFVDQLMGAFIVGPMVSIYFVQLYRDLANKTNVK